MRSHFLIAAAASAALIATVGCSTFSTSQQDYQAYLDGGKVFYTAYCTAQPKSSYCTADAKRKAADAYKTASAAITAYNDGTGNLAAVQKAVADAFKLYADFKG